MLLTKLTPISKRIALPAIGSVRTLINKATIIGRVGQDAQLNTPVEGRSVVNFSVATSETRKDPDGNILKTTHWHRIVSWEQKLNPMLAERVKKGDLVYVDGPVHYKSYTAKDGGERQLTEIVLKNFKSLSPKSGASE